MPHLYKDINPAHLQLLDRSPVQTPVQTAINTPNASTSSTPTCTPHLKPTIPTTPLMSTNTIKSPLHLSLSLPLLYPSPPRTPNPMLHSNTPLLNTKDGNYDFLDEHDLKSKEFKDRDADRVSHLDRSPVQTAFQTRASSREGRTPRMHGKEEAEETVKVLRAKFEECLKNLYANGRGAKSPYDEEDEDNDNNNDEEGDMEVEREEKKKGEHQKRCLCAG